MSSTPNLRFSFRLSFFALRCDKRRRIGVADTTYLSYHVITKKPVACLFFPKEWCPKPRRWFWVLHTYYYLLVTLPGRINLICTSIRGNPGRIFVLALLYVHSRCDTESFLYLVCSFSDKFYGHVRRGSFRNPATFSLTRKRLANKLFAGVL